MLFASLATKNNPDKFVSVERKKRDIIHQTLCFQVRCANQLLLATVKIRLIATEFCLCEDLGSGTCSNDGAQLNF